MAKETRFAEIYRQQLLKDKGILGAFFSTASERAKEQRDMRRLLPKSGITGAIAQRIFGKAYRSGSVSEKTDSARISRVDRNSQLTAKNTSILPAMAKEMNLTRLNVQKLVKLAGGTPSRTSTLPNRTQTPISPDKKEESQKSSGGLLGGLFGGIGGLIGGALGGISSIFGGLLSVFGTVGGGLLKGVASIFSGMGFFGIFLLAGIGILVSELFRNVDFASLGESFNGIGTALSKLFTGDGTKDKGLIQATKDNWKELVDSVINTKKQFVLMMEAVKAQITNIEMAFDGIGGGWGLLGMLFGVKTVTSIVSGWIGNPSSLIKSIVGVIVKHPGILAAMGLGVGVYNLLNDYQKGAAENAARGETPKGAGGRRAAEGMQAEGDRRTEMDARKQRIADQIEIDKKNLELELLEANPPASGEYLASRTRNWEEQKKKLRDDISKLEERKSHNSQILGDVLRKKPINNNDREINRLPTRVNSPTPAPTAPSKVNNYSNSRESIEDYLGRSISDEELDLLYRATYAESAHTTDSYGNVMAVILNRARNSGKSISQILGEKNQFQAVTGTSKNNNQPSHLFIAGPSKTNLAKLDDAALRILPNVSKSLDSFTATDPAAYGPGTSMKQLEHLKSVPGSFIKDGTIFAENQYNRPNNKLANSANTPKPVPTPATEKSQPILDQMETMIGTMLATMVGLVTETNKGVQTAMQQKSNESDQSIPNPYDDQLPNLLEFHVSLGTSPNT